MASRTHARTDSPGGAMSTLAFNKEGEPFSFDPRTDQLRLRRFRNPGARGTCEVVLDGDGEQVHIDADADHAELRHAVNNVPGFYRLDQCELSDDSIEATAVMTALMLGLRASAVVKRTVEDLDDDGWLLWVRDNKTEAGDLEIEVPEVLRKRLLRLAEGKQPGDRLFGNVSRHWLHYHAVRLCEEAGVPRVTPHGVEDVARALGHRRRRRYAQGALPRRRRDRVGARASDRRDVGNETRSNRYQRASGDELIR